MYRIALYTVFLVSLSFPQTNKIVSIHGHITYLTLENVYCDIGTNKSVTPNDTLRVFRRNEEIGTLVVQQTSSNSSICNSLIPIEVYQLGDRVLLEKIVIQDIISDFVTDKPEVTEEKQTYKFNHDGRFSFSYSYEKFSDELVDHHFSNYFRYKAGVNNLKNTQLFIYGKSNNISNKLILYQMQLAVKTKSKKLSIYFGRLFPKDFISIGIIDGLLIDNRVSPNTSFGFIAGFQPNVYLIPSIDRWHHGITMKIERFNRTIRLNGYLAIVQQIVDKRIDKEIIYTRFNGKINSNMNVSLRQTLEIYHSDDKIDFNSLKLVSNQVLVKMRLWKNILLRSRISYSEQPINFVTESNYLDTLITTEFRTGWFSSVSYQHHKLGRFQTGVNLRYDSREKFLARMLMMFYNSNAIKDSYFISFKSYYIKNLITTGVRNSIGCSFTAKLFSIHTDYEHFIYGYGNNLSDYQQHILSINGYLKMSNKLTTTISVDLVMDKNNTSVNFHNNISYRF